MSYDYDTIKSCLKSMDGVISFKKRDGSHRTMRCTLRRDALPEQTDIEEHTSAPNKEYLAVWDLEKNGWRSFRIDSIEDVTFVTP